MNLLSGQPELPELPELLYFASSAAATGEFGNSVRANREFCRSAA